MYYSSQVSQLKKTKEFLQAQKLFPFQWESNKKLSKFLYAALADKSIILRLVSTPSHSLWLRIETWITKKIQLGSSNSQGPSPIEGVEK